MGHRLVSVDGDESECLTCGSHFASDDVADAVDCGTAAQPCHSEDGSMGCHYFSDVIIDDDHEGSHCEWCGVWA